MTDHKEEALGWLKFSGDQNPEVDGRAMHSAALAQVHATLELVEQQRTTAAAIYLTALMDTAGKSKTLTKDASAAIEKVATLVNKGLFA